LKGQRDKWWVWTLHALRKRVLMIGLATAAVAASGGTVVAASGSSATPQQSSRHQWSVDPADTAPGESLAGPGVVNYKPDFPLFNSKRLVRRGTKLPDGFCSFTSRLRREPDAAALTERQLAYDAGECRLLVEVGERGRSATSGGSVLSSASTPTTGAPSSSLSYKTQYENKTVTQPGTAQSNPHGDPIHWVHAWFRDPLRPTPIHVNDVSTFVSFNPNGTCACPPGSSSSVGYYLEGEPPPFAWSGSGNFSWSVGCASVFAQQYMDWQNSNFPACLGGTAHTYYNHVTVTGYPDGKATYEATLYKGGALCQILLTDAFETDGPTSSNVGFVNSILTPNQFHQDPIQVTTLGNPPWPFPLPALDECALPWPFC
jgi:hypothetical protein